ncbi:putative ribosomal-protein-alanine acetyltransferase [Brevibacillus reuszeri]|uniref:GNAT family N-acetyltransferase n=1 Tax=Brevibacillus reuszeri TaxID=54915 RepID=UPI001B0EBF5D|nr:GNAT family protein [Brevibacillus reuszeri]GIO06608.1 putative ribosomal-protein-alanine acetyltransferase [Brevibacillus reuszeri]
MQIHTDAIYLRPLREQDAAELLELRLRNQDFLAPFEPIRPPSHLTLEGQQQQVTQAIQDFEIGNGYAFGVFLSEKEEMIGRVALSNVVHGAWQNATLGYFMDQSCNGRGYTTSAVGLALQFAFTIANLHRVQAAVMPRNLGSIRVLEKNGFRYEGLSLRYLQIYGKWEDHNMYAITAEDWHK